MLRTLTSHNNSKMATLNACANKHFHIVRFGCSDRDSAEKQSFLNRSPIHTHTHMHMSLPTMTPQFPNYFPLN